MNRFAITNAKVVLPDKVIRVAVVIRGKSIIDLCRAQSVPRGVRKINARGDFISAGFIDLHIHGDIEQISRQQARSGTTGFLATLHPAKPKALLKDIAQALAHGKQASGAKVLGLRLEGPFLNRSFCGALPRKALRLPDITESGEIIRRAHGALKMMVLAPELKNALPLIRFLKRYGVIASIGHTGASYEIARKAIAAGASHATHTFNRMRGLDHHDPGALGAVLEDKGVACEVIADGIHVHPAALRLLFSCKGQKGMMLVTDSTAAQKQPPKTRVGDVFKLKNGTLYGTALTLNKALRNIIKFLSLSLPQAVRLVTLNPAKVLKIERRKGSIAAGKDADLVIFDKNFKVKMTIVEGNIVFSR